MPSKKIFDFFPRNGEFWAHSERNLCFSCLNDVTRKYFQESSK